MKNDRLILYQISNQISTMNTDIFLSEIISDPQAYVSINFYAVYEVLKTYLSKKSNYG